MAKTRRAVVLAAALAATVVCGLVAPAQAESIPGRSPADPTRAHSIDRDYILYAPAGAAEGAQLLTVLHGCKMTHEDIQAVSAFDALADQLAADADPSNDLLVLYPFVTDFTSGTRTRDANCWGFWFDDHIEEGDGEVGDVWRMIQRVEAERRTDPDRRYVAGLSSGAAMSVALGVAHSEDIAAVAAVAGLPYGETACAVVFAGRSAFCWMQYFWEPPFFSYHRSPGASADDMREQQRAPEEARLVPLFVAHSLHDARVPVLNARNLRDAWLDRYDIRGAPERVDCTSEGVDCARESWRAQDGRLAVETALYDGARRGDTHYWVGDEPGPFANPNGPSMTALIWDFFSRAVPR